MTETAAAVLAVVVHYDAEDDLRLCLEDLTTRPDRPDRLVVIDNASILDQARWRADYPGVHWIFLSDNRGYGGAVNLGATYGTSQMILALNPDARLAPGALQLLVDFLREHAQVG